MGIVAIEELSVTGAGAADAEVQQASGGDRPEQRVLRDRAGSQASLLQAGPTYKHASPRPGEARRPPPMLPRYPAAGLVVRERALEGQQVSRKAGQWIGEWGRRLLGASRRVRYLRHFLATTNASPTRVRQPDRRGNASITHKGGLFIGILTIVFCTEGGNPLFTGNTNAAMASHRGCGQHDTATIEHLAHTQGDRHVYIRLPKDSNRDGSWFHGIYCRRLQ